MLKSTVLPQPEAKGRSFYWPPLQAALSILKISFFFWLQYNFLIGS